MSRERILNHPGHASQKSHGRSGGAGKAEGKDLTGSADYEKIDKNSIDQISRYAYADRKLSAIQEEQGFNGKPQIVSRDEFDRAVAAGEVTELHRGILGENAGQYAEEYRSGPHWPGMGAYGSGTYAANDSSYLDEFTPDARLRIALRPDARVITLSNLRGEHGKHKPSSDAERSVTKDLGRFAALKGYDAVDVDQAAISSFDSPQVLILNRTAVIVQEA